jgi:hypothetical protein
LDDGVGPDGARTGTAVAERAPANSAEIGGTRVAFLYYLLRAAKGALMSVPARKV